jgi:hypothetical protein
MVPKSRGFVNIIDEPMFSTVRENDLFDFGNFKDGLARIRRKGLTGWKIFQHRLADGGECWPSHCRR